MGILPKDKTAKPDCPKCGKSWAAHIGNTRQPRCTHDTAAALQKPYPRKEIGK